MRARDGVLLATDVWRPASEGEPLPGPFPAVLVRTPYNRTAMLEAGEFWACHGYLAVFQDCRGRFGSGGRFNLLADEGPDGYDAVEWSAELPYCDGKGRHLRHLVSGVGTERAGSGTAATPTRDVGAPGRLQREHIVAASQRGTRAALAHVGGQPRSRLTGGAARSVARGGARRKHRRNVRVAPQVALARGGTARSHSSRTTSAGRASSTSTATPTSTGSNGD